MDKQLIFLFFVLTQSLTSGTAITDNLHFPIEKIVGGHEAKPHSHPYLASLQMRFFWVRAHVCGGALLNEKWILSAGHCVIESWLIRWLPMDAILGTHDVNNFDAGAQVIGINKRISHPRYRGGIGPYDIAMLELKSPVQFSKQIQPINLPRNFKDDNLKSVTLAGWGVLRTTIFIPDLPDRLQEVNLTYLPFNECYETLDNIKDPDEQNPLDREANICTGPITGGKAACSGDSGGPLVLFVPQTRVKIRNELNMFYDYNDFSDGAFDYRDGTGEGKDGNSNDTVEFIPVVVGITSWGASPCGQRGAPTVYTKVFTYLDFINQYINVKV